MMWTERQARALQTVFDTLNKSGIKWMVLRNYEGLPESNRSKDIDLLLSKEEFPCARDIITDVLRDLGFDYYSETVFQYVWCLTFYTTKAPAACSIKIDLLDGFVWRGAQVVSFANLYARRMRYKDFFVPDPLYDGFMLWLKPLMTGGFIKEKYRSDILRTLTASPQDFRALLVATFGSIIAEDIWPLLERKDLDGTVAHQRSLCHAAWRKAFSAGRLKTISATIDHFYKELRRRSNRPKASMIGVIGPDGAGKSTFIELLHKELCRTLIKEKDDISVLHFRPNLFPNIKRLLKGRRYDETSENFTSPHRAKPAGIFSSFLRLTYYWLDYLLGYWLKLRKRCIAGKVYIFDRYFYDFIVDPYRSRINLREWIRLFFLRMTPEPDVVFILLCDASTVYARKQELTLAEIERQLQSYRSLAGRSKRFVMLDASKSPHELCDDAVRNLIEKSFHNL